MARKNYGSSSLLTEEGTKVLERGSRGGFHSSFSPYVYLINRDREARGSGSKREEWQAMEARGREMKRERERVRSLEGKRMGEERRTSGAHMVHSCSRGQVFVHEPSVLQIRPSFSMSLYLYTG